MRALLTLLLCFFLLFGEENFLLLDGQTGRPLLKAGNNLEERFTPCSTFKIALSLMGFDSGILIDETTPVWPYQAGYDDFLEVWKTPQTPLSWIKTSCVWYSRLLIKQLGEERVRCYLSSLQYGNRTLSKETDTFWIQSSLKISAKEQCAFILKMLRGSLPVTPQAVELTKRVLFIEHLPQGGKLFGKTGWGGVKRSDSELEIGWFVGWVEKERHFYPFAYHIRCNKVPLDQRISRVKALIPPL